MTFKGFEQEMGTKKEWYVTTHRNMGFYMITRYPESFWVHKPIRKEPMTLYKARKFRNILNKLKGN